jgi:hypothetical protein
MLDDDLCVKVPRTAVKPRKVCRKDTVETLARLTMPPRSREPIVDSAEVARLWIANRCFACAKCPRLVARLAKWHSGVGEV